MNPLILTYSLYLILSIAMTFWVARTLHRNGRIFLVESFGGRADLADSVNHLLVVGFYLVNLGFISLALKQGLKPSTAPEIFEVLSTKVGIVLLVLGAMHFSNLLIFHRLHRRHQHREAEHPPVAPVAARAEP
jgi:hypothetical protein